VMGIENMHYLGYYLSVLSPEFSIPPLPRRWNFSGPVKMTCNYNKFSTLGITNKILFYSYLTA
jgi:hypothetical protein